MRRFDTHRPISDSTGAAGCFRSASALPVSSGSAGLCWSAASCCFPSRACRRRPSFQSGRGTAAGTCSCSPGRPPFRDLRDERREYCVETRDADQAGKSVTLHRRVVVLLAVAIDNHGAEIFGHVVVVDHAASVTAVRYQSAGVVFDHRAVSCPASNQRAVVQILRHECLVVD